jgi:hypothetical protein
MRRDYDRKLEELNKVKLNIIGEQFILDSQINIMLSQNQKIEDQQSEYNAIFKKRHFELDKDLKEVSKQRVDVENELRALDNEFGREAQDNYDNKMTIIKDREFDILDNKRHALEVKLGEELIKVKEVDKKAFEDARKAVEDQFKANADLQKGLSDEEELKKTIEAAGIKLDLLQI